MERPEDVLVFGSIFILYKRPTCVGLCVFVCLSGRALWTSVQCLYHRRQSVSARPHTAHMLASAMKKLDIPSRITPLHSGHRHLKWAVIYCLKHHDVVDCLAGTWTTVYTGSGNNVLYMSRLLASECQMVVVPGFSWALARVEHAGSSWPSWASVDGQTDKTSHP